MNANEIMTNEEAMEVAAEIVTGGSNTKAKIAVGLGITGVVGFVIYKVVKHVSAKRKAKKELLEEEAGSYHEIDEDDIDDDYVEDEE